MDGESELRWRGRLVRPGDALMESSHRACCGLEQFRLLRVDCLSLGSRNVKLVSGRLGQLLMLLRACMLNILFN